jgi:hypothetical protein
VGWPVGPNGPAVYTLKYALIHTIEPDVTLSTSIIKEKDCYIFGSTIKFTHSMAIIQDYDAISERHVHGEALPGLYSRSFP